MSMTARMAKTMPMTLIGPMRVSYDGVSFEFTKPGELLLYSPHTSNEGTTMAGGAIIHNTPKVGVLGSKPGPNVVGDPLSWQVLTKVVDKGTDYKSTTYAMQIFGGVVMRVATRQGDGGGDFVIAEAVTFVPGARIAEDKEGGKRLV